MPFCVECGREYPDVPDDGRCEECGGVVILEDDDVDLITRARDRLGGEP